jgi:hypothetical protein
MTFWMVLWKVVFISSILLFAGMSVGVIIFGFRDIKKLFKHIRENKGS